MLIKKDTIIYYSEIGHNNIIYPNKDKFFTLQEDLVCETLPFFNSERFIAIKLDVKEYPSLYWIKP